MAMTVRRGPWVGVITGIDVGRGLQPAPGGASDYAMLARIVL